MRKTPSNKSAARRRRFSDSLTLGACAAIQPSGHDSRATALAYSRRFRENHHRPPRLVPEAPRRHGIPAPKLAHQQRRLRPPLAGHRRRSQHGGLAARSSRSPASFEPQLSNLPSPVRPSNLAPKSRITDFHQQSSPQCVFRRCRSLSPI